jgi:hypothetical protein
MGKPARDDVFALLVELVGVLDDNPDDLAVVVQPPNGTEERKGRWTAEVCDTASMNHVAGAIARATTGTMALRSLLVGLRDQLERRVREHNALISRVNAWLEADHG